MLDSFSKYQWLTQWKQWMGQKCPCDLFWNRSWPNFHRQRVLSEIQFTDLKLVNFIEIGTYQPVISVTDGRKFRNEWYAIYVRIVPHSFIFSSRVSPLVTTIQNGHISSDTGKRHGKWTSEKHAHFWLKMKGHLKREASPFKSATRVKAPQFSKRRQPLF